MVPNIIVMGILNTKGEGIKFIRDKIIEAGGNPIVVEASLGEETNFDWVDYPIRKVLEHSGKTIEELFTSPRKEAATLVGEIAKDLVMDLYRQNKVDGIIAYAGATGTGLCTVAMRALPVGIPKFMLTTSANQPLGWRFVGTKDLCLINPIAEMGVNRITRPLFSYAAYGIVGAASAPKEEANKTKPLVGLSMFGVTTPCCLKAAKVMESYGNDTIIMHTTGMGGKCLEEQIAEGNIAGLLDLTTHELWAHEVGGKEDAGPDRMLAAVTHGIPQVVAPGALDFMLFETHNFPEKYKKEVETGVPGRNLYSHSDLIRCPGTTLEEIEIIAQLMANKLNKAHSAPVSILVPMKGWSAADMYEGKLELGQAKPGPSAAWLPAAERPDWSQRAVVFIETMKKYLDLDNPYIEMYQVDKHLNEPAFAELAGNLLHTMMTNSWEKGAITGLNYVERVSR